jgi:hypothetical protein
VIGVVVVDAAPAEARALGGLPVPLRGLLALQQAGVSSLAFAGREAEVWAEAAMRDDRVRGPVAALDAAPAEPFVAVAGACVVDTRAIRSLLRGPGVVRIAGEVAGVHRSAGAEAMLDDRGLDEVPAEGTWRFARTDGEARDADDALYASLRKPQDGIISRAINRELSIRVTRLLAPTGLRPNQVSIGILALGVGAAVLAARGTHGALALAGLLFNAQSILDGCDGELARLTYRGSRAGEWIDTVGDDFTNYGYFAGAAIGLTRAGLGSLPLAVGGVGLVAGVTASLIEYRYLLAIGSGDLLKYPLGFGQDAGDDHRDARGLQRLLGLARPLFKRDFFVFAAMLAAFAGPRATLVMLCLFAVGAALTLAAVLRSEWARRGHPPGEEPRG